MVETTWLAPDQIFADGRLRRGVVAIADDRIMSIADTAPAGADLRRVAGALTPGYIDLQVNGGGGVLFNTDPTPAGLSAIIAAHRRFGTTSILPTIITDAPEVLDQAVQAVIASTAMPGLLGLHIEGPHIAPTRRGTHAACYIRPLDTRTMNCVARLRQAKVTVLITLAPEAATSHQIAALVAMGAIVSLGHTDASADEVRAAIAAGASCFTHLFNAMSPMSHRAPGAVGAAINSTCYAGLICDGIHVDDEMLALAIRARPAADRMFLVSDAMPTVGGADQFLLNGHVVRLDQGRLINAEGVLAGAHVTMAEGVRRLVAHVGVTPECALRMAITVPAQLIGRTDKAQLVGAHVRDLLVLDQTLSVVAQGISAPM